MRKQYGRTIFLKIKTTIVMATKKEVNNERESWEKSGKLMGRTPCCSKEGLNKGAWTAQEDKILKEYVRIHGEGKWGKLPKIAGNYKIVVTN